jgi:hypothetical protein
MTIGIARGVGPLLPEVLGKQQAFPSEGYMLTNGMQGVGVPGLTKREWLTGMALAGLSANGEYLNKILRSEEPAMDRLIQDALALADKMLERFCNG